MLEVGFGQAEITPAVGTPLSGFVARNNQPSTGVDAPLYVRVLAIRHRAKLYFLFSYELLGIGRQFEAEIFARLEAELDLDFCCERCVLTAVHNHSGPVVGLLLGEPAPSKEYVDLVTSRSVVAATRAVSTLEPSRLYVAERCIPGLTYNRRTVLPDGRVSIAYEPDLPFIRRGPLDERMRILLWRNLHGQNVAGMIHYACHGVSVLSQSIGADIPGELATSIGNQVNAPCLFLQGAAGDVNPIAVTMGRRELSVWRSQAMEHLQGLEASFRPTQSEPVQVITQDLGLKYAALPDVETARQNLGFLKRIAQGDVASPDLQETIRTFKNTMNLPKDEPLDPAKASGAARALTESARLTLAAIESGKPLDPSPFSMRVWRLGEMVLVFFAGEIFTATGQRIQNLRSDLSILPISYASPLIGYLPDAKAITLGGYEVDDAWRFYGHPAPFAEDSEMFVVEKTTQILQGLRKSERP